MEQDSAQAARWFKEAARQGHREAQHEISICYYWGKGVDEDKEEAVEIGRRFAKIGYRIFATAGTAAALKAGGVKAIAVRKIEQESPNLLDLILGHEIDLVIDTPAQGAEHAKDGFVIRRNAIETGVNVLTAMDTARALITSLENTDIKKLTLVDIAEIK